MDPILGGLITGGASLVGNMFSSSTSAANTQAQIAGQQQMQSQAETFNAGQAQINRDFQAQMSNTAYQRATADMKAAGLNPAMMFGSGGASSTPGGGSASVGTPTMPTPQRTSPFAGLGDAASKVVSSAVQAQTFNQLVQQVANLKADEAFRKAETVTEKEKPEFVASQTGKTKVETGLRHLEVPVKSVSAREAEAVQKIPSAVFDPLAIGSYGARKVEDIASPIVNSASKVMGLDILKNAFRSRNSATAVRRGMDMERTFGRNNAEE